MKTIHEYLGDMMDKIGLIPHDPTQIKLIPGEWNRFRIEGEAAGKKSGSFILRNDGGYYAKNWKTNEDYIGFVGENKLTRDEKQKLRVEWQAEKRRRLAQEKKRHEFKAQEASQIFNYAWFSPGDHPYLLTKKVFPYCAKIYGDGHLRYSGWLMIPLYYENSIYNVQFISPDGEKRFLYGAKKKGCYSLCGEYHAGDTVIIAEGFATGATMADVLDAPVFIGIDAGNMILALESIFTDFGLEDDTKIFICADNDESGTAKTMVQKVMNAFSNVDYMEPKEVNTDWNDTVVKYGEEAKKQIKAYVSNRV